MKYVIKIKEPNESSVYVSRLGMYIYAHKVFDAKFYDNIRAAKKALNEFADYDMKVGAKAEIVGVDIKEHKLESMKDALARRRR